MEGVATLQEYVSFVTQNPAYLYTTLFVISVIFYRWLFGPNKVARGTIKEFNNKDLPYDSKRRKNFPNPFPNGWFAISDSLLVKKYEVRSVSCLGKDFVVFRGEDGKAGVLDAFCPHIGAHLGGGKVEKNTLRCPFHGWKFGADGDCKEIPYCTGSIPKQATIKSYEVREKHNKIWFWFDAEDRAPLWEPIDVPEVVSGEFYYVGVSQKEFKQHVAEMAENSADYFHFDTLHSPFPWPKWAGKFFKLHHIVRLTFPKDRNELHKEHICYFDNDVNLYFLGIRVPIPEQHTNLIFEGPSIVHFRVHSIFGDVHIIKSILPVEHSLQYTEDTFFAAKTVPLWFSAILMNITADALEQDRFVWESKTYNHAPVLVSGDGPFPAHRRWYKQFFSENSKKVSNDYLDW